MNRKFIFFILILIIIVLSILLYKAITTHSPNNILPPELTTDFNPTMNAPVFNVIGVEGEKLLLQAVFPEGFMKNQTIKALINCSETTDMRIYYSDENNVMADKTLFFETIEKYKDDSLLLSGICEDSNCNSIYKECNLSIAELR